MANSTDISLVLGSEARRCAVMLVGFAVGVAHLHLYPLWFGVKVVPSADVPPEERQFFHHGWTAMLVIAFIEAVAAFLKIWSTRNAKLLKVAVLQKLEGNIGVLFGEYFVVVAAYALMSVSSPWVDQVCPVFEEARTNRRVYGARYMEWAVDACGLVYLDCRILFGLQSTSGRFLSGLLVYTVLYMLLGLWAAIAHTWILYSVFLAGSWFFFCVVCYQLFSLLRAHPEPLAQFGKAPIKHGILLFIITWWSLYGVLFMACFAYSPADGGVPQWVEQLLWTGMDVVMKLSHTVVLMAYRDTQWEIDAVVSRKKALAQRFVAQLDHRRAIHDRDLARLRARVYNKSATSASSIGLGAVVLSANGAAAASGAGVVSEGGGRGQGEIQGPRSSALLDATGVISEPSPRADGGVSPSEEVSALSEAADVDPAGEPLESMGEAAPLQISLGGISITEMSSPAAPAKILPGVSTGNGIAADHPRRSPSKAGASPQFSAAAEEVKHPFARVSAIFGREAKLCALLCVGFLVALFHLPLYSSVFGVELVDAEDIPDAELQYFHHGWTCMVVAFLIEVITVLLKLWSTRHDPALMHAVAVQLSGNLGMLIAEYLVVGATYAIMGCNWMPVNAVFREPRTGRRVYGVRYMEWLSDACGLVYLDCHCLLNRDFAEFKMAIAWTIAYIMLGLWSAIAATWAWY